MQTIKQKYGFNVHDQKPEDLFEYALLNSFQHIEINLSRDDLSINTFTKDRISKLRAQSEKYKVILALENVVPIPAGSEYYLLGDSIEDLKYIYSHIDSDYLKFCLDTGHANTAKITYGHCCKFNIKGFRMFTF